MFDEERASKRRRAVLCPGMSESDYLDFMKTLVDDDTEEGIREIEIRRIEKRIYQDFRLDIDKKIRQNTDGRMYLHIGAHLMHKFKLTSDLVNGRTRDEILDKLIVIFYGDYSLTMQQAFEGWMKYRFKIETEKKTMLENKHDWNALVRNRQLGKKLIVEVTAQDLNHFFDEITAGQSLTSKRFSNIKSIIKLVFEYYVGEGLLTYNPVYSAKSTSSYRKRFKISPPKQSFSEAELKKLVQYLQKSDDIYDQAVLLACYLFVRVSELVPLKYSDLRDGKLWLCRSTRRYRESSIDEDGKVSFGHISYRTEERMKGNLVSGYRWVPVSDEAVELIERIHNAHPDWEYLFMFRGHQICSDTFNHHLKAACKAINIPYRPSHQIRFANATRLHKAGVPVVEISKMMGHSNVQTTFHYLRQNEASESTIEMTKNILSYGSNPEKTSLNEA